MSTTAIIADTAYGRMLLNRLDPDQVPPLVATGKALDHELIQLLKMFIEPGSTVIDAGACFGTYTMAFAPHAKEVHTFEAQRVLSQYIAGSAALNGFQNVHVHNEILSYSNWETADAPVFDYAKPFRMGCAYFCARVKQGEMVPESIEYRPTRTLDHYFLQNISLIKLDVEGMEIPVLNGAKETIKKSRPVVLAEHILTGTEPLIAYFKEVGKYIALDIGMDLLFLPEEKWQVLPVGEGRWEFKKLGEVQ